MGHPAMSVSGLGRVETLVSESHNEASGPSEHFARV
jgi:hypothetical protein